MIYMRLIKHWKKNLEERGRIRDDLIILNIENPCAQI